MSAVKIKNIVTGGLLFLLLFIGKAGIVQAIDSRLLLDPLDLEQQPKGEKRPEVIEQDQLLGKSASANSAKTGSKATVIGRKNLRQRKGVKSSYQVHKRAVSVSKEYSAKLPTPATANETLDVVRSFWPKLVMANPDRDGKVAVSGKNYSVLDIDPSRYPTLAAADGGNIIIDPDGSINPLVKSVLQSGKSKVRIVTESPVNRRPFILSLLSSAGFFSLEENFNVSFGQNPEVMVHADFKIEKTRDSLLSQEMTLLNVAEERHPLPSSLIAYLSSEGIEIIEPFAQQEPAFFDRGRLCQIRAKDPLGIADGLLRSLAIPFERGLSLELLNSGESGLTLNVTVDRYFEKNGARFVLKASTSDPLENSLIRLLEAKDYSVITLEKKDDLANIAGKILTKLKMQGDFGRHYLWEAGGNTYSVQLSGVVLHNDGNGRRLFLTELVLDPLVRELADINGYQLMEE